MKKSFSILARYILAPIIEKFFIEKIEGEENILHGKNFIIAANHQSYFDHFFIAIPFKSQFEKVHFIGKMETPYHPLFFGPLYFFTETITVNRKSKNRREVLKKVIQYLKKGKIIVIYPEGGTNRSETLKKGKTGVAELAIKTEVPVVPVGVLNKDKSLKRIIRIGKPIYFSDIIEEGDISTFPKREYEQILRKVTDKVMTALSPLCGKGYPYFH
ncbi:MAG: hypothetical protein CO034_02990 [Parcubacteria group bacterium CG_4_9_14_0_2_um_filter_35_11]|nr:MAG: hypothetical protein CO034_02990 [Parcubacteria group bacterium CG_4_9_14_0_2_um_filter_35_11]